MSTTQFERINVAMQALTHHLDDIDQLAMAVKERDELRRLLIAVVEKTERGSDGDLYVRIGGGLRLLPRGMIEALEEAKQYLD